MMQRVCQRRAGWGVAAALLTACAQPAYVRATGSSGGTMRVAPPINQVPPLADGQTHGEFHLRVRGNDALVGLRWLPGVGSRLRVEERDIDEGWVAGPDGGTLDLRYFMVGDAPASRDTGAPPDDGILRLFFGEHPTVDVWVEVIE